MAVSPASLRELADEPPYHNKPFCIEHQNDFRDALRQAADEIQRLERERGEYRNCFHDKIIECDAAQKVIEAARADLKCSRDAWRGTLGDSDEEWLTGCTATERALIEALAAYDEANPPPP